PVEWSPRGRVSPSQDSRFCRWPAPTAPPTPAARRASGARARSSDGDWPRAAARRSSGAFADSCPLPSRPRALDRSLDDHALFLRVGIFLRLERPRRRALGALPPLALLPRPAPLEALARGIRPGPVPDCVFTARGQHIDAVHGAGRNAQVATGAKLRHDRVHHLRRSDDGIDRAGLDAQSASDAARLVDQRDAARPLMPFRGLRGRASRPSSPASPRMAASPPGGHWLISASPLAIASAYGLHA